jgi:aminobenzoyl-glutamate transport protein
MSQSTVAPKTTIQKMLDVVERAGNKVPHPAVLFFILIGLVILLSQVFQWLGTSGTYQRMNPLTHAADSTTAAVRSLLSAEGVRFICTSVVPNFINFGPVGIIMVAMIGVGLAERSGLIQALIRKIVVVAPPQSMTAIIVTLGVSSSIASDAGYLVLIPLGAVAFHSLRRHPLAGLAEAFAGVAAAFGANFFVKLIDRILAEMTNDAIHIVDPSKTISLTANHYFGVASSLLLIVVCTLATTRIVEPRLGKYAGDARDAETHSLSADESRGLLFATIAFVILVILVCLLTTPRGAPLRNPATSSLSPYRDSLVFLIVLAFLVTGIAYGVGAKTISTSDAVVDAITKTFADLGGLLFLFFVISQFVAYFSFSNVGTVLAVRLADLLKDADLNSVTLLLAFLVIGFFLSIPIPNILPKWAIVAPVFVTLFLKLGVAPDIVLAAYRVSDSPPNVIILLLPVSHWSSVLPNAGRKMRASARSWR